ncbi:DUF4234 domain-containing protein [Hahella ganghwensis]|uniref:DUF4234 domain-containing protein n=1 Tax=Hahella ganghwensis TaxID=286420 RepID=UPI0003600D23|nr:DUF4234 domain-containing protein [Hahella ganghwensis]
MQNNDPSPSPETPPVDPQNQSPGIADFPRLNVALFVALTMLSFSMYFVYWMFTRSQILNRQLGTAGISLGLMNLAVSAFFVYVGVYFYFQANPERGDLLMVTNIFALICQVLFLVWIFKIRNRLHLVMGVTRGHRYWCNALLTFLFNAFYVQYKINQMIDGETDQVVRRYTREL